MNMTLLANEPCKVISGEDPQGILYLTGRYLEHLRVRHYSQRTVYRHSWELTWFRRFCEALGITQARQVTRAVILNYQSHLFHYRKGDGTPLTVGTQKAWLGALAAWFSFLTREGLILYNPASDLDMPRKQYRLPKVILSHAEVEAIMSVPDLSTPMGIRDRAILETLYSTGIRRMELCQLDVRHVDLQMQLAHIEHGKGNKPRFVPIGERALQWVEKYLVEVRPRLCPSINDPALFLNTRGVRLSECRLGSAVHEMIRRSGVGKSGGCHLFRHAFATGLLHNGCDLRHIQLMLGHAGLESTQIYTHVSIRQIQEAHRKYHPAQMPEAAPCDGESKSELLAG
jgi:integrase/recombinase XerD